jgi:5-oxoprolinase (ATP-hydrolysing)
MTPWLPTTPPADAFAAAYQREYGFNLNRPIIVDDIRVRAAGRATPLPAASAANSAPRPLPPPAAITSAYFDIGGRQDTPVYQLGDLEAGQGLSGPAILIDEISTVVVEPGWRAEVTGDSNVRLDRESQQQQQQQGSAAVASADVKCDPIQLAIFSHRYEL